ncbi:MAG: pyridoxal phosphate-dependent aminotransferase [Gemmatimonadales bacterium]
MERRRFIGTSLALGAAGTGLLSGCAPGVTRSAAATGAVRPLRGGPVRLSANENPLGLSPLARRAIMEDLGEGNRYPRQARLDLLVALAAKHGVPTDHIQLGTGSTEILKMAVDATSPDAVVVIAEPTFEDVAHYANSAGRRLVAVPLRPDGAHDLERMRAAAGAGPALVFICNPNNPTGTLTSCDDVEAWIAAAPERITFLVDEAYFEFPEDARYRSAAPLIASKPNVVVSRTFSKIHAMAGLRLGYALAQPATIQRLRLFACGQNANELALVAGRVSLGDEEFHERTLASNRAARAILMGALDSLGLTHLPSHTNFVMHQIRGELTDYIARMREAGFQVGRPFPPMLDHSRVSLGLPEEMERFVEALRGFRARSWV